MGFGLSWESAWQLAIVQGKSLRRVLVTANKVASGPGILLNTLVRLQYLFPRNKWSLFQGSGNHLSTPYPFFSSGRVYCLSCLLSHLRADDSDAVSLPVLHEKNFSPTLILKCFPNRLYKENRKSVEAHMNRSIGNWYCSHQKGC